MKLIKVGNFCEVVTDRLTDQGVKRGHIVYVAGHRVLPVSEGDPYTQRIKFLVHLTNMGVKESDNLYLIDPNSIQPVSKSRQKKFEKVFDAPQSTN